MKIIPTAIPDVLLIEPTVFGDARGFFFESFNAGEFERLTGIKQPQVSIQWPLEGESRLSAKDTKGMPFAKAEVFP